MAHAISLGFVVSAIPHRHIEGKYEILQKLREGGMGAIYKVRHRLLDEVRVIKLMRPQLGDDPEFKQRFIREARAAIRLRHPNIAHLYDFTIDDDDTAFIVMEFIDGRTFEDLLDTAGPPPLGLALEMAQQSLRALACLHGKGYVHRDIAPDNLMLAEDADGAPQVKLIDLGIAKVLGGAPDSHLTRTGTFLGKLRYASPEQFGGTGAPPTDRRGDLYSFGVVLYEMLTGIHPVSGSDPPSIIAGHLFRPPIPFEQSDPQGRVPENLRAIVLRALAKSPDERHGSAQDFARELAACRAPQDLEPADWRAFLARAAAGAGGTEPPADAPGSTQHRLDQHFGPATTPAPSLRLQEAARLAATLGPQAPPAAALYLAPPPAAPEAARPEASPPVAARPEAPDAGLRRARDAELAVLLVEIRRAAAAGTWAVAGNLLRRARRLAPDHPEVVELREQQAETARQRGAARQRAARISRRAAEIGKRLDRGDTEASTALLAAAAAELGPDPAWLELDSRLAALRAQTRLAQVGALLMNARQLLAHGELDQASEKVEAAHQLEPANPGVHTLGEEIAVLVALRDKERRRAGRVAETAAAVAARLDQGELADASRLLDLAVMRYGPVPPLHQQWERLETMKRHTLAQQVEGLLARARQLADAGDLPAARAQLQQARALGLKTSEHQAAAAGLDARLARAADARRAEELLQDARLLLKVEDREDASRKLLQVLELVPDHPAARTLLDQARKPPKRP